ncbi:thiamine pyrophosphate-dependent enzyme [Salipiger mucosus]
MCVGELATAVQYGADVTVIVFNDGALSLIDLKQQQRGMKTAGVRWPSSDFAAVARGFGAAAWRVGDARGLRGRPPLPPAPRRGRALIDVVVDPSGYAAQLKASRG